MSGDSPPRPRVTTFDDPRMRGFHLRASVSDVRALIASRVRSIEAESIAIQASAGRVLAREVVARASVPGFDRSAMDGYAVRGVETQGPTHDRPVVLRLVGSARPGRRASVAVGPGEAVEIATGAPIPDGADAVVMVESTRRAGDLVFIIEPVGPGRHVGTAGEDIAAGSSVLPAGRVLRPQDLGVLSALRGETRRSR